MSLQFADSRGVTLFEACVVAAIIGLLSTIGVPRIRAVQEYFELRAAAFEVRSELHRTRILSITRNQDCRLRVTSPSTYLLECQTPAWLPIEFHTVRAGHAVRANNRPEFHPRGNVAPMATITLSNAAGDQKRLIVNRSGRVRME
jgi:Tfp pilus assembly protein FimT